MNNKYTHIEGPSGNRFGNKETLVNLIIKKQNARFLFGWNYCSGTSYYREVVYWAAELTAMALFLVALIQDKREYLICALVYFIKHCLLLVDYVYLIVKQEYLPIELLTNLLNLQFWVEHSLTIQGILYFSLRGESTYTALTNLYWSPLVKLILDSLLTCFLVFVLNRGSTVDFLYHAEQRTRTKDDPS